VASKAVRIRVLKGHVSSVAKKRGQRLNLRGVVHKTYEPLKEPCTEFVSGKAEYERKDM